jgi:hypothetical protein
MTISDHVREAWSTLEAEPNQVAGLYERRVHGHSGYELFAGLSRPEKKRRLTLCVPSHTGTDGLERAARGFTVCRRYNSAERRTMVVLELNQSTFREIFGVMAEDIAQCFVGASTEDGAVAAMRSRLDRWERFMSIVGPNGLSREEQVGLFGELIFLLTLLEAGIPGDKAVSWWHGPDPRNQDFQHGNRSVEVKATTTNSSSILRIANELQLDNSDCETIYLFHLWIKDVENAGLSLPALIDRLRARVAGSAQPQFDDHLIDAGYHDIHRDLYKDIGYIERERSYYIVEAEFPRVTAKDLRDGVSKVRYQIDLAGFQDFRRSESQVISSLAGQTL